MKSVHIGPFLGMNNQLPQTQYNVPDEGDFVRDARNVDILDSGTLRRRSGYTKLLDGRFSSLYAMGAPPCASTTGTCAVSTLCRTASGTPCSCARYAARPSATRRSASRCSAPMVTAYGGMRAWPSSTMP